MAVLLYKILYKLTPLIGMCIWFCGLRLRRREIYMVYSTGFSVRTDICHCPSFSYLSAGTRRRIKSHLLDDLILISFCLRNYRRLIAGLVLKVHCLKVSITMVVNFSFAISKGGPCVYRHVFQFLPVEGDRCLDLFVHLR